MIDLRQTKEYAEYMESLGWSVVRHQGVPACGSDVRFQIFIRGIPLVGKVAKLQRPRGVINSEKLTTWARQNQIAALYVESSKDQESVLVGYKSAKSSFLPSKTIQINLRKSEKQLLREMKPKTRYNIHLAQKRGVIIRESKDIDTLIDLWTASAKKRGMWLPQKKEISALWSAFGKSAHLLLAYYNSTSLRYIDISKQDTPLAGVLMVCTKDIAYYMYAGSTTEGKKLFAPTLVAWEAIKLAKKAGCKIFDFEGIYDERYHSQTKAWQGFTRFKQGFGGQVITYPQTLVKYKNFFYKLWL